MGRVFVTSDTHFGHEREFLYGPRNFSSIQEHDEEVIRRWNSVVQPDDIVYHLGDVMLNDNDHGMDCLRQLNGEIIIIPGNHDTKNRLALYETLPNVRVVKTNIPDTVTAGIYLKYRKYMFYLSHHPTMTSNLEKDPFLKAHLINIFGHTHQQKQFYNDIPFMFHAGLDSNNCTPVLLDDAIEIMREEMKKCVDMLDIDDTLANVAEEVREGGEVCPTRLDIWTTIVQRVKKLFSRK
jgi:calcineurin-like phosphoesterase family protein